MKALAMNPCWEEASARESQRSYICLYMKLLCKRGAFSQATFPQPTTNSQTKTEECRKSYTNAAHYEFRYVSLCIYFDLKGQNVKLIILIFPVWLRTNVLYHRFVTFICDRPITNLSVSSPNQWLSYLSAFSY